MKSESDHRTVIALLFGGRSAEHEVSILSARSVREAAPPERFEVIPICIARDGRFMPPEPSLAVLEGREQARTGHPGFSFETWSRAQKIDIAFPMVHGTFGEDGTLQGYLEILGLSYVGSGVTASSVGMDKGIMKQAFATAKLPIVEYVVVTESEWTRDRDDLTRRARNTLRLPYFVKPANAGSSVGVTKVKKEDELFDAVDAAFRFDDRVLVERGIDGREIEVSVLGNDEPLASVPGEVVIGHEFYDYEDKYIDHKSSLLIPAKLQPAKSEEIRKLAIASFRAIGASGYARVDFFLERGTDRIFVNEINTVPGFTSISMYPKLWEATELKYPRLIERMIELGLERGTRRRERFDRAIQFLDETKSLSRA